MVCQLSDFGLSDFDIEMLFFELDSDGDDELTRQEFVSGYLAHRHKFGTFCLAAEMTPTKPADRPVNPVDRPVRSVDKPVRSVDRAVNPADRPVNQADRPVNLADRMPLVKCSPPHRLAALPPGGKQQMKLAEMQQEAEMQLQRQAEIQSLGQSRAPTMAAQRGTMGSAARMSRSPGRYSDRPAPLPSTPMARPVTRRGGMAQGEAEAVFAGDCSFLCGSPCFVSSSLLSL